LISKLDFLAEEFEGAGHAGGETVQLAQDGVEERDWGCEDIGDSEAHGLVEEVFHLEEAELLVDELVDEGDLGGCDWVELFEVVGDDGEGDVVIVEEAIKVFEAEEAVFEGVGGGAEFAGGGTGTGGFLGVGAVG